MLKIFRGVVLKDLTKKLRFFSQRVLKSDCAVTFLYEHEIMENKLSKIEILPLSQSTNHIQLKAEKHIKMVVPYQNLNEF